MPWANELWARPTGLRLLLHGRRLRGILSVLLLIDGSELLSLQLYVVVEREKVTCCFRCYATSQKTTLLLPILS